MHRMSDRRKPRLTTDYNSFESEMLLSYTEICDMLKESSFFSRRWMQTMSVPIAVSQDGKFIIYYNDEQSFEEKGKYIFKNGFGGVALWTFNEDDSTGTHCERGRFPLVNSMRKALHLPYYKPLNTQYVKSGSRRDMSLLSVICTVMTTLVLAIQVIYL